MASPAPTAPGWLVITSIAAPTPAVRAFAVMPDWNVVVVGDTKTPGGWDCDGVHYLSPHEQGTRGWTLAEHLPWGHYARKNLGYLHAAEFGAPQLFESDDDNFPAGRIPTTRDLTGETQTLAGTPWVNPYPAFTDLNVWPRGLPLQEIHNSRQKLSPPSAAKETSCSVHQFVADGDPDVDAVYRMTVGKADHAFGEGQVVIEKGSYAPFNSQSTLWFPEAYTLLYLPSHVSFRMTDIWRSFVAQACLHAAGLALVYRGPVVRQDRNEHNLAADFAQEVPGYLHNEEIVDTLRCLTLDRAIDAMGANLIRCYEALVQLGHVPVEELMLIRAWLRDLTALGLA